VVNNISTNEQKMNNKSRDFSTDTSNTQQTQNTVNIPDSPQGWDNLKWLGPSFLWMLSAAGSGELLFTPRIAALYGYTLLWALLAAVVLKWFINGEVGRFSVCAGATILEGFKQLPGPKNWAIWLILLPQIVVAISTVAGLSGAAATALINDRKLPNRATTEDGNCIS
jgi:Mn2+/Fe2+ NRAMP family transporter